MSTELDWFRDEVRLLRELRRSDLAKPVGPATKTVTKRRDDEDDPKVGKTPADCGGDPKISDPGEVQPSDTADTEDQGG